MREINSLIHRSPVLSYFSIIASALLGFMNLLAFTWGVLSTWTLTSVSVINLAMGLMLTTAGSNAFIARRGGAWKREMRALPWLVGGAVFTTVIYFLGESYGLIPSYVIGLNALVTWTLWIRFIELTALDKSVKEILVLERNYNRPPRHV